MQFARYADLIALLLALPVFIVAELPLLGYAAGAAAWVVQRAIQLVLTHKAVVADNPRSTVGLLAGSMIARGWLVALTVFLVGLSDNDAGLAAAVFVVALFTVYFTMQMILRPLDSASVSR